MFCYATSASRCFRQIAVKMWSEVQKGKSCSKTYVPSAVFSSDRTVQLPADMQATHATQAHMVIVKEPTPTLQACCILHRSLNNIAAKCTVLILALPFSPFSILIRPVVSLLISVADFRELSLPLIELNGIQHVFQETWSPVWYSRLWSDRLGYYPHMRLIVLCSLSF